MRVSGAAALHKLVSHAGPVVACCFYSVGSNTMLATGSTDKSVLLWDACEGTCIGRLDGHEDTVTSILYLPSRGVLATGSLDMHVKLWDVTSAKNRCLSSIVPDDLFDQDPVKGLACDPQGTMLAAACQDNDTVHMHLWDLSSMSRVDHVSPGRVSIEEDRLAVPMATSPDGHTVAVSEYEHILLARKGAKATKLAGHSRDVTSIAYTQDGIYLVSGSQDCTVRVWDALAAKQVACWEGHGDEITCVATHPSGMYAASASKDRTLRLWSIRDGRCLALLTGHAASVQSVAFSADGKLMASTSQDGTARIWVLNSQACMDF